MTASMNAQLKIGASGTLAEDLDDIHQCIRIILETPLGSDPHRPFFGSNLHRTLDGPLSKVRPHLIRESLAALERWEKRITVVRVQIIPSPDGGSQATLRVAWTYGAFLQTTTVSLQAFA